MVGAVILAILMALVIPAGLAGAVPVPASSTPQTIWAYGAVKTVNFQGTSQTGWEYSGNATYGFSVILNQTNTSANGFELTVNRTMGALFQVHYCYPSCQSPRYFGNVSDHVYETVVASANLTSAGAVDENGTAVPAIALNNSQSHLRANATEVSNSYLPLSLLVSTPVARSHYLGANVVASSTVDLSPGLGILPVDLSAAQSWNSTSQFTSLTAASYLYYESRTGPLGTSVVGPLLGDFSVPASGNVSLYGSTSPAHSINLGGVAYPEVSLKVVGPFAMREGFILLPATADLFGGGALPWTAQQNGTATATMSYLDARASQGGHLGIGASEWVYDSSTLGPASTVAGLSGVTQLASSSTDTPDAAPPTTVQGSPESVPTAASQQNCLLTGGGCPAGNSLGGSGFRGLVGLLGVGVILVVVIAVVLLVAERRRMPPPTYPNAALYPPGNSRPGARAPSGPPPPPAEDDPLRNLW
ncbi:MAG: hypothetical protein WB852_08530 [Thermoplasmata archaeon]